MRTQTCWGQATDSDDIYLAATTILARLGAITGPSAERRYADLWRWDEGAGMVRPTGYGAWIADILVQVQKPHDSTLADRLNLEVVRSDEASTVLRWHPMVPKLRDDEAVLWEWCALCDQIGIPCDSWSILWNESSF